MANNQKPQADQKATAPEWIGLPTKSGLLDEIVSLDFIARHIDRPSPWLAARIEDLNAPVILQMDGVSYYRSSVIPALKQVSDEWAEKIRLAKREAVAMGE